MRHVDVDRRDSITFYPSIKCKYHSTMMPLYTVILLGRLDTRITGIMILTGSGHRADSNHHHVNQNQILMRDKTLSYSQCHCHCHCHCHCQSLCDNSQLS
jgi:hypothetical protein